MLVALLLTFGAFTVSGCGGGSATDPAPANEETISESPPADGDLPSPISAEGAESVSLSDRLITRIRIGDPSRGPDWMVAGFGSLWVKRDDGLVVRVDPGTGRVVAEVGKQGPLGHVCQGIGVSEGAIWSCPPSDAIQRIDPESNSVAATIDIEKLPEQGRIVSAGDRVWVLTDSGSKLFGIDPGTDRVTEKLELDARCFELVAKGDTLFAMCPLENRLLRVDAEAVEVVDELALPGASNASIGEDLWVGFQGGVAQIDPRELEVLAVYDVDPLFGGSIFATDDAVWVRHAGGPFLTRIDPRAQRVAEVITAPGLPSGGDVVQIGKSVWATAYDDATLVELSR